jgi:hypothetical protein
MHGKNELVERAAMGVHEILKEAAEKQIGAEAMPWEMLDETSKDGARLLARRAVRHYAYQVSAN